MKIFNYMFHSFLFFTSFCCCDNLSPHKHLVVLFVGITHSFVVLGSHKLGLQGLQLAHVGSHKD